jgi:uroporphyrinogen-III synthase
MTAPILMLTRPDAAAQRFAAQLGLAVETLFAPLIRIDQLDVGPLANNLRGIILTSENGAAAAGRIRGLPPRAYCVGDRTAEAGREEGFDPISANGDANALIALILSLREPGPLLHIRGEHARGDIAVRLNAAGIEATEVVAYRQQELPLSQAAATVLQGSRPLILPLFSPRTVSILAERSPLAAPLHVVCISRVVAERAKLLVPMTCVTSTNPDAVAMANAVRNCLDQFTIN